MLNRSHILLFLFSFVLIFNLQATHNRAGEITYKRIPPFTDVVGGYTVQVYNYSITLTKYTDHGNNVADRCVDTIYFGDGERGIAMRINGNGTPTCNCWHSGNAIPCGSLVINDTGYLVKLNTYTVQHTYAGAGYYLIRTFDPNRNKDVHNIPNSDERPFYIESLLIINSFTGANSSPQFKYAPIDRACLGECFEHSPGAYDPDGGDSLSYEITAPRGVDGQTVTGYFNPETGPNGIFEIDPRTGILRWCAPQLLAEYNIAFIVKEWRKNTSDTYELIGYILRDMQVIVRNCKLNKAPILKVPPDMCVEAGEKIDVDILFSDPNDSDIVTIEGAGGAFEANNPKPVFTSNVAVIDSAVGTYTASFIWQTTCDHVRQQGYQTYFKASDSADPDRKSVV